MSAASTPIARVLVDSALPQLDRLLDYRIPPGLDGVAPGVRVKVPLRAAGRVAEGFVVGVAAEPAFPGPLSDVAEVVSPVPVLRPEVWALARSVADRAAGSANDILRVAIPPRQVRVEKAWLARDTSARLPAVEAPPLEGYREGTLDAALDGHSRIALTVDAGVAALPDGTWVGRWAITLAAAAARSVARGESAILVVPDYRDEEQLHAALRAVLPAERVARFDARQPNADRYRAMLRATDRDPIAMVGPRSVVYAPAAKLGLLAVWNDGDPLLGEPLAPYVHARDAALVRADQQRPALVIAGHTRSTEAQRLVEIGYLEEIAPAKPKRPKVIPTADSEHQDGAAAGARIPSLAWREARGGLDRGPVLVQVSRPGYAPGLRCGTCGEPARCARCAGPLRRAAQGAPPTCSWCGKVERSWRCSACSGSELRTVGSGSVRTADELGRAFPGVRVVVSDGSHPVERVPAKPALVIATRGAEPIADGGYAAVLLLDGERMLARESLRVVEDCLRWWMDAAVLAADDATVALVGLGGDLGHVVAGWRPRDHAARELESRRALRFPPTVRMATLTGAPDAVRTALDVLPDVAETVGVTESQGSARAIIRFDYAHGAAVATAVRAEIIRQATARRKGVPGAPPPRGKRPLPLKARFDDPDPFEN